MITQSELREVLHYDPDTGDFRWLDGRKGPKRDRPAGCTKGRGYREIRIDRTLYYAHRLAWLYMTGQWPQEEIDHRDRNPANNRFDNLREASRGQNVINRGIPRHNSTGFRGVFRTRNGTFYARVYHHRKAIHLGTFPTAELASQAYEEKVAVLFAHWR